MQNLHNLLCGLEQYAEVLFESMQMFQSDEEKLELDVKNLNSFKF